MEADKRTAGGIIIPDTRRNIRRRAK
nr:MULTISPECIES: hypothetical protein [unclassified Mesorhizobium]